MAFDVDEFAGCTAHGDEHYLDVARILCTTQSDGRSTAHRTICAASGGSKSTTLSPARGRPPPSLAAVVATSQLNGIFGLMEFDRNCSRTSPPTPLRALAHGARGLSDHPSHEAARAYLADVIAFAMSMARSRNLILQCVDLTANASSHLAVSYRH